MPFGSAALCVSHHWVMCAFCCWALAIIQYNHTCYVEIADIVDSVTTKKPKPTPGGCPYLFATDFCGQRTLPFYLPDVFWNPKIIKISDKAFIAGKILAAIPAGVLSDLGYSKYILGGGVFLIATSHMLQPAFCEVGITAFVVLNTVEGIGEASVLPSIISLISRWTSPSERNMFTALVVAGLYYGDTLGHVFFHLIYMEFSSWSLGQYTSGTFGLVWSALWFVFIYHYPDKRQFISEHEGRTSTVGQQRKPLLRRLREIPWCSIVSSRPFLSLVLVYCSLAWANYLNIWETFAYYQEYVLHLPERFSKRSSVIRIAALPTTIMGGVLADWLIKHNVISKTAVKRSFAFTSVFCSAVLQITSSLFGCNIILFWVFSIAAVYTSGLVVSVIYSAPVDLCPRHAGLLMGIMTAAVTICLLFNDTLSDVLEPDRYNADHWWKRFLFGASVALVMTVPFLFYGSGETQLWKRSSLGATHPVQQPPIELNTPDTSNPPPR